MIVFLLVLVVGGFFLWKFVFSKVTKVNYDNTILFTGGLGCGKTLNTIGIGVKLYKQNCRRIFINNLKAKFLNKFKKKNKYKIMDKPMLISNIPIYDKLSMFSKKRFISTPLTRDVLTFKVKIPQYSVVIIDEMPMFINQWSFNLPIVKNEVNEFITFFRHYIGGYLILNCQSISDCVSNVRRKLGSYYLLYDFKRFWKFYYVKVARNVVSDENMLTNNIDPTNSKFIFGMFKDNYDSRCYRYRYINADIPFIEETYHSSITTTDLLTFNDVKSVLDKKEV